jgi:hypothetical protein
MDGVRAGDELVMVNGNAQVVKENNTPQKFGEYVMVQPRPLVLTFVRYGGRRR